MPGAKTIEPDPVAAPAVRTIFENAATGTFTLNALRTAAYETGLRSRRAKRILCKEEVRRIVANPIYMGDFVWKGRRFEGKHEPIVSAALFERAQVAMGLKARPRKTKHDFAFTGLVRCGHCGASLTPELKKGKYTYYRCSKQCDGVVYLPEAKLSQQLGEAVRRIRVTREVVDWTREALLQSHADQAEHHRSTVARLQARREKLASYLDQAYTDRLEGRIAPDVWERRAADWERERTDMARQFAALDAAKTTYRASGVKLLELAERAYDLYVHQTPQEQRRLLNVIVSNCVLANGTVRYDLRKPFDLMADVDEWRGGRDSNPRPPA